jgi:DNA-binding response OmpR family regulator
MSKILVVDDEPAIIDILVYNLTKSGHQPIIARDGKSAIELARSEQPDLIILDLLLPEIDGLDVCRAVRRHSDLPIIMLTAKDDEFDRVLGLELGADDYVVKPFSVRELMARVKTVLRRVRPATVAAQNDQALQVGELRLDLARHEATFGTTTLELTAIQFDVLRLMMSQPTRVFTREELLNQVWGYDFFGDTRTVDSTIKRLRARLREAAPEQELIVTVRDVGYKLAGAPPGPRLPRD